MCERGKTQNVVVWIEADLSHDGKGRWAAKPIDSCISDLVRSLSCAGIHMRGSCCGHNKGNGIIELVDGRQLIVKQKE